MVEEINYYNKYLKYKKKYLDLERKYHTHRHMHRHHLQPIGPLTSVIPLFNPPSPIIVRPASPIIVRPSSPIIVRPFSPFTNDYNEFDPAFDFINNRFDRNIFLKIFNLSYNFINKTYKGNTLSDMLRDKKIIETKLIELNIFTLNKYNSFELLINKISSLNYQLQDYIKKYVILNEMINIIS